MRRYRICENMNGAFKIQFKVLGLIWWDYKEHLQGIVHLCGTLQQAEKYIKKLEYQKEQRKIKKYKNKSWQCRGEY